MAFTYKLSTDVGKIRLAIGDWQPAEAGNGVGVRPSGDNLSDEELEVILGQVSSWQQAAPLALTMLANEWALEARTTVGSVSQNATGVAATLREQAAEWSRRAPGVQDTGVSWYDVNDDGSRPPFFFGEDQWGAKVEDQRQTE